MQEVIIRDRRKKKSQTNLGPHPNGSTAVFSVRKSQNRGTIVDIREGGIISFGHAFLPLSLKVTRVRHRDVLNVVSVIEGADLSVDLGRSDTLVNSATVAILKGISLTALFTKEPDARLRPSISAAESETSASQL